MGIFSSIFLVGFVSTSSGNFCSKRFANGKWISLGDCGGTPHREIITNDLTRSVSCSAVLPSEGLKIDCTGTKFGDKCKFSCEKGFNMNGVGASITCVEDGATGRWSGTTPACRNVAAKCESLEGRYFRQKCYTIPHISSSQDMNYDAAVSKCAKQGALLAEIHDRDQQNELRDFVFSKKITGPKKVFIWVGMEYQSSTSKLLYRSGKLIPSNQLQWYSPSPSGSQKYLLLAVESDGNTTEMVNSYKLQALHGVLCERDI